MGNAVTFVRTIRNGSEVLKLTVIKKAIRAMSKDFQAMIEAVCLLFSLTGDEDSEHEPQHQVRLKSDWRQQLWRHEGAGIKWIGPE